MSSPHVDGNLDADLFHSLSWWGYGSQFNMLDYSGVIIPIGTVDKMVDRKDEIYSPVGPKDKENYDMCRFCYKLDG